MADTDPSTRDRGAVDMAAGEIAVLLERRLEARGDNLTERVEDAGEKLPDEIAQKIRFIETTRDLLISSPDAALPDRPGFDRMAAEVIAWLTGPEPARRLGAMGHAGSGISPSRIIGLGLLAVAVLLIGAALWGIVTAPPEGG